MRMLWVAMGMYVPFAAPSLTLRRCPCVTSVSCDIVLIALIYSNQKLLQMQEYTHVLMQLGTGSPPYVPYDAPMPHACKQVLNTCPIETMNVVVLLLPIGQSFEWGRSIWLHHPCLLGVPIVGKDQYGYITLTFSGPHSGETSI